MVLLFKPFMIFMVKYGLCFLIRVYLRNQCPIMVFCMHCRVKNQPPKAAS